MTTTAQLAAERERRRAAFAYARQHAPAPSMNGQGFKPLPVRVQPVVIEAPKPPSSDFYGQFQMARRFIEFVVWLADEADKAAKTGTYVKRITIARIQEATSAYFKMGSNDLKSVSRRHWIVYPRQVAMYLCRTMTTQSYPEIGRRFGGRDHTTAIHAVRKVGQLVSEGNATAIKDVAAIKRLIENGW